MTQELPTVISQRPEPITGGEELHRAPSKIQYIGFHAYKGTRQASFSVLAAEGSPTLTGGWVKLAKIQRFQRVSVTVPEGYDPLILTVPIMFDATSPKEAEVKAAGGSVTRAIEIGAQEIEAQIKLLEWMAGREEHPHSEITGEPPYVEVYTENHGTITNLVPSQFQTVGTANSWESQQWWITNITYDPNPLRFRGGDRIRQIATVELTEIVLSPSALQRALANSAANKKKLLTFKTNSQVNTVRKVAVAILRGRTGGGSISDAYKEILAVNKLGNDPDKKLKDGTPVKYPESLVKVAPR